VLYCAVPADHIAVWRVDVEARRGARVLSSTAAAGAATAHTLCEGNATEPLSAPADAGGAPQTPTRSAIEPPREGGLSTRRVRDGWLDACGATPGGRSDGGGSAIKRARGESCPPWSEYGAHAVGTFNGPTRSTYTLTSLGAIGGHTHRVLHLAQRRGAAGTGCFVSAAGGGDDTMRFWQLFGSSAPHSASEVVPEGGSGILRGALHPSASLARPAADDQWLDLR
jgi:hypothetical protein